MKKFLLMATAVSVAFTSCVNDNEAVYQQENNPQPITFQVAKYKPASRAEGDGTNLAADDRIVAFETDKTFGTFAYMVKNGEDGHSHYMDNVKIMYYNNGGYWAAVRNTETVEVDGEEKVIEKHYVWPNDGHLDFISYYPYTETVEDGSGNKTYPSTVPQISDDDNHNTIRYNYDITSEGAPHDLMYSDKAVYQVSNEDHYGFTGVPTLFHHALAKLNFAVKATKLNNNLTAIGDAFKYSWEVTVKSITLNNIYKEGSVDMTTTTPTTASATTTSWRNKRLDNQSNNNYNVWTVNTSTENDRNPYIEPKVWSHTQTLTTESRMYNGSATNLAERAMDYYIIPQSLSNQTITIVYDVVTKDKDGNETDRETVTVTKNFNSINAIPAWEMGKSITYIIDIDPEGDVIHFAPAVVDWEAISGTISI